MSNCDLFKHRLLLSWDVHLIKIKRNYALELEDWLGSIFGGRGGGGGREIEPERLTGAGASTGVTCTGAGDGVAANGFTSGAATEIEMEETRNNANLTFKQVRRRVGLKRVEGHWLRRLSHLWGRMGCTLGWQWWGAWAW